LEITLKEIAELVGGEIHGNGELSIAGINSLDDAGPEELSFFADRRYRDALRKTRAGALLISGHDPSFEGVQVVVPNPELAYARVASLFAPPLNRYPGISPDAVVHEESLIGKDVSIFPMVYVGRGVEIGDGTTIFPGVYVGEGVKIGRETIVYPNVTILRDCLIGNHVILHSGTVIGSDGFGFVRDGSSAVKIPQTGIVQIDDHVEIGANNCIDRAALGKTWIKEGTKTDNLVQIAHNVIIGEGTIVVAQAGISGSCRIGRGVVMGGQVGTADHIEIGDMAMIAPQSGVVKSISPGEVVSGTPAISHRLNLRITRVIPRLPEMNKRLRDLEKRIEKIEQGLKKEGG